MQDRRGRGGEEQHEQEQRESAHSLQGRRESSASPRPNATNMAPVSRSHACTTEGFASKRAMGRVAAIRHANQTRPRNAWMAPSNSMYGATRTPGGTNCGRNDT